MRAHAAAASTLIAGARQTYEGLRGLGLRVASSTGYTRDMMQPVLAQAAAQGYTPDHVVCAGDTPRGRPNPADDLQDLRRTRGVAPIPGGQGRRCRSRHCRRQGCRRVHGGRRLGQCARPVAAGVAVFAGPRSVPTRLAAAREALLAAGADVAIDSVADLIPALQHCRSRS